MEYRQTPPVELTAQVNQLIRQFPHHNVVIQWDRIPENEAQAGIGASQGDNQVTRPIGNHPRGYQQSPNVPTLCGSNYCAHCLCSPCVIQLPPDFLRGAAGPHSANDEKRHRLYRMFWRVLRDLGLWRDNEYLQRKKQRTRRDDRRDILPTCVTMVIIVMGKLF